MTLICVDDVLPLLDLERRPPTAEERLRAVKFLQHSFQVSLEEGGKPGYFDFDSIVPKLIMAERSLRGPLP